MRPFALFVLIAACGGSPTPAPVQASPAVTPIAEVPPAEATPAPPEATPPPSEATPTPTQACGGFAGLPCPEGARCIDDPSDSCDPAAGGADCMGMCVDGQRPKTCRAETLYVGDPEQCTRIRYTCEDDQVPFQDACGCGCEPTPLK